MFLNKKSTVYSARNVCYKSNHEEIPDKVSLNNILYRSLLKIFRNDKLIKAHKDWNIAQTKEGKKHIIIERRAWPWTELWRKKKLKKILLL